MHLARQRGDVSAEGGVARKNKQKQEQEQGSRPGHPHAVHALASPKGAEPGEGFGQYQLQTRHWVIVDLQQREKRVEKRKQRPEFEHQHHVLQKTEGARQDCVRLSETHSSKAHSSKSDGADALIEAQGHDPNTRKRQRRAGVQRKEQEQKQVQELEQHLCKQEQEHQQEQR